MSQFIINKLPRNWWWLSDDEKAESALTAMNRRIRKFLVDYRHYYPGAVIGKIEATGFFHVRLPGPQQLSLAIGCYRNKDRAYSVILFMFSGNRNVRCINIGYKKGPVGSKILHTYEDLLSEIQTVYSWVIQGHVEIMP